MRDVTALFAALRASRFRARFRLRQQEAEYLARKSLDTVLEHARRFVTERLAPAAPVNDGQQTPLRGHPAFVAQHATATCCRTCLAKWHRIETGRPLTAEEIDYIVVVIEHWLRQQPVPPPAGQARQLALFPTQPPKQ